MAVDLDFLDSNVWVYAFASNPDDAKHIRANELILKSEIRISTQIIGEVCNALLRKVSLTEPEIQIIIRSFYRHYQPVTLNEEDFLKGSELRGRYKFSHWDSLIVAAALRTKCSILYSEDMHDGLVIEGTLTIRNPFKEG
ncbi:MAG TPA: PIN domain-containing protein [Candidatus Kapabacteria bacterium]|nr:PIN domain-containing protein [Candidatus Kapabacteria bacterium]